MCPMSSEDSEGWGSLAGVIREGGIAPGVLMANTSLRNGLCSAPGCGKVDTHTGTDDRHTGVHGSLDWEEGLPRRPALWSRGPCSSEGTGVGAHLAVSEQS